MRTAAEFERAVMDLSRAYAAFNRGDVAAAVECLDPEVEWIEPAEFPGGGTYHGPAAVQAYLSESRAGWSEGRSDPEQFVCAGDHIVVFVRARFRPTDGAAWREIRLADVYTFGHGRVVRMHAFVDRDEALRAAGIGL